MYVSGTCEGTYGLGNWIISPNFPQFYERDKICSWTITAPLLKRIKIKVGTFIPGNGQDSLYVYDGANADSNPIEKITENTTENWFYSSGNTMHLSFRINDGQHQAKSVPVGFNILYHVIDMGKI